MVSVMADFLRVCIIKLPTMGESRHLLNKYSWEEGLFYRTLDLANVARMKLPDFNLQMEPSMFKFDISNMTCGHCASTIARAIREVDDKAQPEFDIASRVVR